MYKLGKKSKRLLKDADPDWTIVMNEVIKITYVDISVVESYRTTERQQELYAIGRTKMLDRDTVTNCDGINKKSKHNYYPSKAIDICIHTSDPTYKRLLAYDQIHLAYVIGVIQATARILYDQGKITHLVRSGSNWDNDGILKYDQNFFDMPHLEFYIP